ncbi:MAG: hypothetical protein IH931_03760 [candidate division Zixibacteria bacterium]|nr:hypothetical protein [candidate division Zixibacteria bacterium]
MKISPIGIDAYRRVQNVNNLDRANKQQEAADKVSSKLTIKPQQEDTISAVSIKPSTVIAENVLNGSEKAALDQLIKVISENSVSKLGYSRNDRNIESPEAIGKIVDVKV